ncbi:RapZ C-terminal domain-containing protein [Streptomyces indicus]|uniref:P-loop ATPase protein family protein n=1 Tax=Streptomyces indicus TaxID=417292 RepID=A0A1G9JJR6_9ACTN|nr:P-loop ATPase protein family protein [Streptomyces indicus]
MTDATTAGTLDLFRGLADLQRESDRLRVASALRGAYDDVCKRHADLTALAAEGTHREEYEAVREELAAYVGKEPAPVDPLDVLAYHRRKVEVFRGLGEAGVPAAEEALAEAEAQLADALRAAPAEIELVSFGYLHGDAPAADLVIDMRRHFRDPHVSPELRELTAEHELVMRAVFATEGVPELAAAILAAVTAFRSGPSAGTVRVAVGCAGGRHRSAAMVNYLAIKYGNELRVSTEHRDIHRPVVNR